MFRNLFSRNPSQAKKNRTTKRRSLKNQCRFERLEERTVFNTAPVVTDVSPVSPASLPFLEDSPITFEISVADLDGDTTTISLVNLSGVLPGGFLLPGPQTGVFSPPISVGQNVFRTTFTPSADFSGTLQFTVVANDAAVNSNGYVFTTFITSVNDNPVATGSTTYSHQSTAYQVNGALDVVDDQLNLPSDLQIVVTKQPQFGSLTFSDPLNPKNFTYQAFNTTSSELYQDSFEYYALDNGLPGTSSIFTGPAGQQLQSATVKQTIRFLPYFTESNGVASLTGTSGDDNIFINVSQNDPSVLIYLFSKTNVFADTFNNDNILGFGTISSGITKLTIDTRSGNDSVNINSFRFPANHPNFPGALATTSIPETTILTGEGNDQVVLGTDHLDPINNNVASSLFGSNGYLYVNGPLLVDTGAGNDRVFERSTIVNASKTIKLGSGNDRYDVYFSVSNELELDAGIGDDTVQIGYLTSRDEASVSTGNGSDLLSVYGSRFNKNAVFTTGYDRDTVALDVVIYDGNVSVDTGAESDYLLFSRSWGYAVPGNGTHAQLSTGDGVDQIYIGKYISGINAQGQAVYSNGGSNIDRITLDAGSGVDKLQVAANVIRQLFAYLGDGKDEVLAEGNLLAEYSLIDGGLSGMKLTNMNNSSKLKFANIV